MNFVRLSAALLFTTVLIRANDSAGAASMAVQLFPEKLEVIALAPLMVTSINFPKSAKITDIKQGSKIVQIQFDPKRNQLDIYPTVTAGSTNLNIRSDDRIYTFLLKISRTEAPMLQCTYTFGEISDDFDAALQGAPILKPFEVDTVAAIKTIERARFDPTFRDALTQFRLLPIGSTMIWNHSPVTLVDVAQFANLDLLAFKIEWANQSDAVLNLDSSDLKLKAANTAIAVTCAQPASLRLFPGQRETIWLFVQGYRISPKNDWHLVMPPDADAVRRVLNK